MTEHVHIKNTLHPILTLCKYASYPVSTILRDAMLSQVKKK